MPVSTKPILISGAGLASLLLAQSLRLSGIPFKIFERDASFAFRAQGYRLRLSNEGIDAIESVLGKEHFQRFWDKCGKTVGASMAVFDAVTGESISSAPPAVQTARGANVIGISRGDMRQIFAAGCEDHIEWSKQVTGYELTGDGVRTLFADGSRSVDGSMLIGADGIYSRIAKQLSAGKLKVYDTGARGIHGQAPSTAYKGLGEGVFVMKDTSRQSGSIFVITNVRSGDKDDPDVQLGWTMGGQPGVIQPPNNDFSIVGKEAAAIAKSLTKDWHPRFRTMFDEMNEAESAFWKITCSTPSGVPEWPNEPRVTVIGDAVHSMTPAGGIGANTAVQDSALLGRLLRESGGSLAGVTATYEKEMRVYASAAVQQSLSTAIQEFGIVIDEEKTPIVN
ncbi:hypothetical protein GE09DRAFT_958984 [Coniochaeta sp. 2T2.1]|nr:hypothetical protein GE09DRAFT_958984 [Coniochaeta sp. 2T2.1]